MTFVPKEKKWGGRREGAGRKRGGTELRRVTISFVCTQSEKELITAQAEVLGISRSEFILKKVLEMNT